MKFGLYFITLLFLSFAFSCSKKPDCMIADNVKQLSSPGLERKGLHIFLRTSGFNEKEYFYELFEGIPKFDECGQTQRNFISKTHVDTSIGMPEKLIIRGNKISIEYSSEKENIVPLHEVTILME